MKKDEINKGNIIIGIAAFAIIAIVIIGVISFFTTGPGATPLPVLIYSSVKRGITPDIHALSTLLIAAPPRYAIEPLTSSRMWHSTLVSSSNFLT